MDIHFEVDGILASLELDSEFTQPITMEEEIRNFLVDNLGPSWRKCALLSNGLLSGTVYTASTIMSLGGKLFAITYVLDRDDHGQWYLATTSPVSGYIE